MFVEVTPCERADAADEAFGDHRHQWGSIPLHWHRHGVFLAMQGRSAGSDCNGHIQTESKAVPATSFESRLWD